MDKISRILPSSSRVTSVDMRDAHAVRPGAPLFGRPSGRSALAQQIRAPHFQPEDITYSNPVDQRNSSIVQDLAEKFFGRNRVDAPEPEEDGFETQPVLYEETSQESSQADKPLVRQADEFDPNPQSQALSFPVSETEAEYSKGQYFDRMA